MRTVHLVHGFNVKDGGQNTTDKLIPYLKGARFRVMDHDYGYFGLLRVRLCNGGVSELVKAATDKGDIGVGHSNGCAVLAEAAARGAPFAGLVFLNPALDQDYSIARHVSWVHVYHSQKDVAVLMAKVLRFNHPWGAMGRLGYTGTDPRVTNIDYTPFGHSDVFKQLDIWGPRITDKIWSELPRRGRRTTDTD